MKVCGHLHALAALPPEKEPPVPLDRRLGGPQKRSGRCGARKNHLSVPGIESWPPSPWPVAIPAHFKQ
jgi:hypothetical protein